MGEKSWVARAAETPTKDIGVEDVGVAGRVNGAAAMMAAPSCCTLSPMLTQRREYFVAAAALEEKYSIVMVKP